MDSIIEVIRSRKAFWQGAPASEDQIAEAELRLGLKFADDYRTYVHAFGCASCCGHEFTGVCPCKSFSVVDVTAEIYIQMRRVTAMLSGSLTPPSRRLASPDGCT